MSDANLEASNHEIDALIFSLLDGEISAESHDRLQHLLKENAGSRRRYRELSRLHSILEERTCGNQNLIRSGHQSVIPLELILHRQRARIVRGSLIAAAAVAMCLMSIMYFVKSESKAPIAQIAFSDYSVYTITHPEGTPADLEKDALTPGSSVELTQGTLRLDLAIGVNTIIQSPALVTLIDDQKVVLQRGRAWFDVAREAKGFMVQTPQLEIVDLGTDFGVSAEPTTAREEVHVFRGKVQVTTRHKLKRRAILSAGQSRSVQSSGRLQETPLNASLFLKKMPIALPTLTWDFDELEQDKLYVRQTALPEPIRSWVADGKISPTLGIQGGAAYFSPNGGYLQTDWKGIDSDLPRTVVCWIKCPMHQPDGSIVEWGIPVSNSAKWRIALNPESEQEGGVKGALRTEFGNGYLIGSTDLRDGRWHQIISIYNGSGTGNLDSIQLYIDGKQEEISAYLENEIGTILDQPESVPLAIGKGFYGSIDQLRIYKGVMPSKAFINELER